MDDKVNGSNISPDSSPENPKQSQPKRQKLGAKLNHVPKTESKWNLETIPQEIYEQIVDNLDDFDTKLELYSIRVIPVNKFLYYNFNIDTLKSLEKIFKEIKRSQQSQQTWVDLAEEILKRNALGGRIDLKPEAIEKEVIEIDDIEFIDHRNYDKATNLYFNPENYSDDEKYYEKKLAAFSKFCLLSDDATLWEWRVRNRVNSPWGLCTDYLIYDFQATFIERLLTVCQMQNCSFGYDILSGKCGDKNKSKLQSYFLEFDKDHFQREFLIEGMKKMYASVTVVDERDYIGKHHCSASWLRRVFHMNRLTLTISEFLKTNGSNTVYDAMKEFYGKNSDFLTDLVKELTPKSKKPKYPIFYTKGVSPKFLFPQNQSNNLESLKQTVKIGDKKQMLILKVIQVVELNHKTIDDLILEIDALEKAEVEGEKIKWGKGYKIIKKKYCNIKCLCKLMCVSVPETVLAVKKSEIRERIQPILNEEGDDDVIDMGEFHPEWPVINLISDDEMIDD